MADVYVETWPELVSAINSAPVTSNTTTTIHIVKDIDCNDSIPEGVASTISKEINNVNYCNLIIDGAYSENGVTKNRIIRNLRTNITSPVKIFYFTIMNGSVVRFKNIDFINLVLDRPFIEINYFNNSYIQLQQCRFVGRRTQSFFNSINPNTGTATWTSCFFNVEYKGTSGDNMPLNIGNAIPVANYCRIKQTYTGWSVGVWGDIYNSPQNITFNLRMNGCYLYGTFVGNNTNSGAQVNISKYYNYNSTIQNVVDADFRMVGTWAAGGTVSLCAPKGIFVNQVRKLNDSSISYVVSNYNSSGNAKAIPIPPDKMDDPAYLYAQGFDVVVPE